MTTNSLPLMAALTARLVYVQNCALCRETAAAYAATCVRDPAIASCQLIASKKNHCCENGEALDRPRRLAGSEWTDDKVRALLEKMAAPLPFEAPESEPDPQGELPISDTNGTLGEFSLPSGIDPP